MLTQSRDKGGTGLGLAIVKHIVNRHRGRSRDRERAGAGRTFTVMFPSGSAAVLDRSRLSGAAIVIQLS